MQKIKNAAVNGNNKIKTGPDNAPLRTVAIPYAVLAMIAYVALAIAYDVLAE